MNSKLISIVVPMYFEEMIVDECYCRLTSTLSKSISNYELIFINDGSTDRTLELLEKLAIKDSHVRVISFSRNFGHQLAVTAGLEKSKGDAVVIIDADLQDPPELIPEMISLWEKGYDVVYGARKKRNGESLFKLMSAKAFYRFLDKMSSVKIPMDTGDFRLIDRKVVEALKKMPEHNRFLRGMSSWIGFKQIPFEYERCERFAGETKYPLKKMLKLAMDGIISFSSKPLKLIEYLGLGTVLISFPLLAYSFIRAFSSSKILSMGSALILWLLVFIAGIQLLSLGIVGEYIARIYDESKGRPLYVIDKELNFEENQAKPIYIIENGTPELDNLQKII